MEIRRKPPNPKIRVENLEYAIPHKDSKARNILEEIIWHKDIEISNFKKSVPLENLIKKIEGLPQTRNFADRVIHSNNQPAIIVSIINKKCLIILQLHLVKWDYINGK